MSSQEQRKLPPPVDEFVSIVNGHREAALDVVLGDEVTIRDEGHTYRGIAEARTWFVEKCIAVNGTIKLVDFTVASDEIVAAFEIDGNFDKSGLPDPCVLDFHFKVRAGKIEKLSIRMSGE